MCTPVKKLALAPTLIPVIPSPRRSNKEERRSATKNRISSLPPPSPSPCTHLAHSHCTCWSIITISWNRAAPDAEDDLTKPAPFWVLGSPSRAINIADLQVARSEGHVGHVAANPARLLVQFMLSSRV